MKRLPRDHCLAGPHQVHCLCDVLGYGQQKSRVDLCDAEFAADHPEDSLDLVLIEVGRFVSIGSGEHQVDGVEQPRQGPDERQVLEQHF